MIELYFASQERLFKDEKHAALELEAFLHHLKQMRKGLSYLISLPFVKFWAEIVKDGQYLDFLDMFL